MALLRRPEAATRIAVFLVACLTVSLGINLFLLATEDNAIPLELQHITKYADSLSTSTDKEASDLAAEIPTDYQYLDSTKSRLAGLSCERFGGPPDDIAAEMVYWRDIPADAHFTSPFHDETADEKFLLWDVDPAGFNNKRISFENFLLLAHTTGRTLVMPAKGSWWGFSAKSDANNTKEKPHRWSMEDFYDINQIAVEQAGFKTISMEDFLLQHAMTGKLVPRNNHQDNGRQQQRGSEQEPLFPPNNRTDWNHIVHKKLKAYLQQVTTQIKWRPETCIGAFPADNTDQNRNTMDAVRQEIMKRNGPPAAQHWMGNPTPVDGSLHDRMEEVLTNRKNLCFYTPELQEEPYLYYKILYDPRNYTLTFVDNIRLLIYYYCFLFFQDWHHDLWAKRFIRDHLRYKDELHCGAARIVQKLRALSPTNDFDVLHIRRHGEFETQYGNLTTIEEIIESIRTVIPKDRTVYIATDEPNRTFFGPLEKYLENRIWYLSDFLHLIPDLDVNFYSIIDQLIATRGNKFFGAFCSTFTGYINRMRGYHSTKSKWKGYAKGELLDSYFYNFNEQGKKDKMRVYHPPVKTWFFREFPIAWRDIDRDVDKIIG